MRRIFVTLVATVALGCAGDRSSSVRAPGLAAPSSPIDMESASEQLVEAHNRIRADRGLAPLSVSPALDGAARSHAADMASRRRMSHRGSDGSSPARRVERAGFSYSAAAENVAAGQRSVEEVMDSWMRSDGHRRNILGSYSRIGTACAVGSDGMIYWCVTFGTPTGAESSAERGTAR